MSSFCKKFRLRLYKFVFLYTISDADSPWTWSDGSESTFTFWDEGEPNFGKPEVAYCAYINRNKVGRWDDNRCDDQQHEILCKIKKHEINAGKVYSRKIINKSNGTMMVLDIIIWKYKDNFPSQ